uniref:Amyloid beta A4 precursor protein-binding family B member 1-interacting protein-like n=1 Tax=Kryptolebias marmoratus TaxID=37003 RepID=A0A3Q3A1I0_KRYMA
MDDIDAMFSNLLGEIDHLSQVNGDPGEDAASRENSFSIGFTDLNESLNELEDHDLDALMADLGPKIPQQESSSHEGISSRDNAQASTPPTSPKFTPTNFLTSPTAQPSKPQTKAEKIKLALQKLKEAKVRKVKPVFLLLIAHNKGADERQELQDFDERSFEDHECLVELLSAWTRHSENKIYFVLRPQKYVMFTEPQLFYMWKKPKASLSGINSQAKELLIKESFGGSTQIVPDLEGTLYLKEDGKKVWKPRYFVLRASGIYYVPKGKTKSSTDLACFVRFEKVNIYTTSNYRQMYRAPTNFCFILKHPCIQMESPYIKFLCCDDEHTLSLWVTSIRIAKPPPDFLPPPPQAKHL